MESNEIHYIDRETAIRANQIAGEDGALLSKNALESALAAPRNAAYYQEADIVEQAAILIQRVALNHSFVDGNKRTAFILGSTFLMINGYQLRYRDEQEEIELAQTIEAMVAEKSFDILVQWVEQHLSVFDEEEE